MERISRDKPSHTEHAIAWWVIYHLSPYHCFDLNPIMNISPEEMLNRSWYQLFVAAYRGEI